MNRAEFGAAIIAATAAPHTRFKPSDLVAEFAIKRDSSDLLAPFTVQISLRNATKTIVRVDFATTDLYRIDVRRDDLTVWSNAFGHTPLAIARRIDVPPGLFRLVSEIVDGTTDDRRAYAPGRYVVRVTMLGTTLKTTSDKTIEFVPPIPIRAARMMKLGTLVTISGTASIVAGLPYLTDESGTIRLEHPLGLHPTGSYVVRGALASLGDDVREFAIERFARGYDNPPEPSPSAKGSTPSHP